MIDPFCFGAKPGDTLPFFDSHCHLQYPDFADDFDQVLANAKKAGLQYLICVGTEIKDSIKAIKLAEQYPDYIYATVGNHPYNADQPITDFAQLITQNKNFVVAVGETGLDYFRSPVNHDIQKQSFKNHCLLAKQFDLPVIIHLREIQDCFDDAIKILESTQVTKAIFHSFTGTMQMAEQVWQNNWKTSFSLALTYPKNKQLREVYANCPPHLKLHETDSPYLPPQTKRGLRNEPALLDFLNQHPSTDA